MSQLTHAPSPFDAIVAKATAEDRPVRLHAIGIGGIGVSAVVRGALALGWTVTGSDVRDSQLTRGLRQDGATVHIGHDAAFVEGVDVVVYSTAVPDTNPELARARELDVPTRHRAELLGHLLSVHARPVGVVGTHGKGTVSSCTTWILEQAGWAPSYYIGGLLENLPKTNSRTTQGAAGDGPDWAVAEVDESDGSLKHVQPAVVIVNNLEADHLNYYEDLAHVQRTVLDAFAANPRLTTVFVNGDDPGSAALVPTLRERGLEVTTFGRGEGVELRATDVDAHAMVSHFTLNRGDEVLGDVSLPLPGLYNVDNAIAASAAALGLGVPFEAVREALSTFKGLENRFTVVEAGGRRLIKDYISHPTGIRRVLEAAKADGRRITAVFKPYRFTMIHYLQDDYAEAFHDASETVITKMYTAGEVPIPGIDTEFLCDKIRSRGPKVTYVEDIDAIPAYLDTAVADGEQVLFFGGDDLFEIADRWAEALRGTEA